MNTIELYDEPTCLTLREVAEQLVACGGLELAADEETGEVCLESGELEIDVRKVVEDDPRCSGYYVRTEVVSMRQIRECFTAADHYEWGRDSDGDDCLYCFGC